MHRGLYNIAGENLLWCVAATSAVPFAGGSRSRSGTGYETDYRKRENAAGNGYKTQRDAAADLCCYF